MPEGGDGAAPPKGQCACCPTVIKRLFRRYTVLKIVSICSLLYIAIWSYAPKYTFGITGGFVEINTGWIIDHHYQANTEKGVIWTRGSFRTIVAQSHLGMVCIGITRASAFWMYPSLLLIFTTKFRATMEIIMNSGFAPYTYNDLHELHIWCGKIILLDGLLHALFHIIRWSDQGVMYLMFDHFTGLSGFVLTICICIICIPMYFDWARTRISYEVRKGMHYFFIPMSIALAFHVPLTTIPNGGFAPIIFPILIIWYFLDAAYVMLFWTEKIESSIFHVVPTGVQLTMHVSEGFQKRGQSGGYCYVCLPWIAKNEWHAYSLFENPSKPSERQIYMQDLGDWTHKLIDYLQRDTHRPVWVQGPFSSPYDNADDFDNQILVAGGIGITPAISVMRKHKDTRRSNLIWAVRDPHMLEFFIKHGEFSSRGWNLVFYTGKQPLHIGDANEVITENGALVHIIRARPDFPNLVPNIIYSIESGAFVPEDFMADAKVEAILELKGMLADLDNQGDDLTQREKLTAIINHAEDLGFLFTDLMSEIIKDKDIKSMLAKSLSSDKDPQAKLPDVGEEEMQDLVKAEVDIDDFIEAQGKRLSGTSILSAFRQVSVAKLEEQSSSQSSRRPSKFRSGYLRSGSFRPSPLSGRFNAQSGRSLRQMKTGNSTWQLIGNEMSQFLNSDIEQFRPWDADATEAIKFVENLDEQKVLSTWGILYCGGRSPLATAAEKTARKCKIEVELESFAW